MTASSSSAITTSGTKSSSSPIYRRLAEASRAAASKEDGGVHRLLRRPLHGGKRRHPARAASESRAARPRRRLLDGRHGRPRPARDGLARTRGDGCPHGRIRNGMQASSRSPTSILRRHQSVCRRARRHRLHVHQRRRGDEVGVGARREAVDASRPASRPQHRRGRWACRSTRWSCGTRTRCGAAWSRAGRRRRS